MDGYYMREAKCIDKDGNYMHRERESACQIGEQTVRKLIEERCRETEIKREREREREKASELVPVIASSLAML